MKSTATVFFFTGNNHLSNVKTLQSIYAQDYPHIRVIVCNDCTYGFDSERLLNNFEHNRPENIEYVVFQENERSIGEYASQKRFWNRIGDGFIVTLHAGEYFMSPQSLSSGIRKLQENPNAAAVACGCECWDKSFTRRISRLDAAGEINRLADAMQTDEIGGADVYVRDCMLIYRIAALRNVETDMQENSEHISSWIVRRMLRNNQCFCSLGEALCKYSEESVDMMVKSAPVELGSHTQDEILVLLQKKKDSEAVRQDMFRSEATAVQKKAGRNIFCLLSQLSTLSRIFAYAFLCLLLFATSALFLNLETGLFAVMGLAFFVAAVFAAIWTAGMLVCNLYLKKNPQRLVS